jgi:hypothetical protein
MKSLSAILCPLLGITSYNGSQTSVPLEVHHGYRGAQQPNNALSHGCNQTLTHPLHNVRGDIHYASMVEQAHSGDSASRHHYPMGFNQMSPNNNEVNSDKNRRHMVMRSPNATHMQYGKLPLLISMVDTHVRCQSVTVRRPFKTGV